MSVFLSFPAKPKRLRAIVLALGLLIGAAMAQAGSAAPAMIKTLGSIRSVEGSRLVIASDQGGQLQVEIQPGAHLLRLQPGQTEWKDAAPIALSDLQVGDRVLVRGKMHADATRLDATTVLVMKQQDIVQQRQRELKDWQRRSLGGLVQSIDAQVGTITISGPGRSAEGGPEGAVVVRTSPNTSYRRYAADSMQWEHARASSFGEIRTGDQLRVLGKRSQDGGQIEAQGIVFGSFRNISGRIVAIDAAQGAITVQDLATKHAVMVRITAESQIRSLPPAVAIALARRLKGTGRGDAPPPKADHNGGDGDDTTAPRATGERRSGDLDQFLTRLPAANIGDLHNGETVMVVATQGSAGQPPTAIIVLDGAEPILAASPGGRGSESLLTPWTLAEAPGGGDQP